MIAQRVAFHKAQFKNVVAEFAVTKLVNVFDACSLSIPKKFQLVIKPQRRNSALFDSRRGK